jgi:hypothetical protein
MIDLIIVPIAMEIFEKKRILFLLFPLMEKEAKRSWTNEWLRPFVRPTHVKSMMILKFLFVFVMTG